MIYLNYKQVLIPEKPELKIVFSLLPLKCDHLRKGYLIKSAVNHYNKIMYNQFVNNHMCNLLSEVVFFIILFKSCIQLQHGISFRQN